MSIEKLKKYGLALFLIFAMLIVNLQLPMAFADTHHHSVITTANDKAIKNNLVVQHNVHNTKKMNDKDQIKQEASHKNIKFNSCCMAGCIQTGVLANSLFAPSLKFHHYNDVSIVVFDDERPKPMPRPPSILL